MHVLKFLARTLPVKINFTNPGRSGNSPMIECRLVFFATASWGDLKKKYCKNIIRIQNSIN